MEEIETLELENKMLRERNERLERDLKEAMDDIKMLVKAYRDVIISQGNQQS